MSDIDPIIGEYVISGRRHDPAEIISALEPISDSDHHQIPWVWKTIADAADRLGDVDLFLNFSGRFIFAAETQRGDYRIGKLAMIVDRVRYLVERGDDYAAELSEFQALRPAEFDWLKMKKAGAQVSAPDIATVDADQTIALGKPRDISKQRVVAISGNHFAAITTPLAEPTIRVIEDVQYLTVGIDTTAVKPDGRFYRHLSRSEIARSTHATLAQSKAPRQLKGTAIVMNDYFTTSNYCHWTLDWFPRLLLAKKHCGTIDHVLTRTAKTRFEIETLEMAGFDAEHVLIDTDPTWYAVDRLITIDNNDIAATHPIWGGNPDVIDLVRQAVCGTVLAPRKDGRRLYISRRDVGSRVLINQQEIDSILEEFGFETVDLMGKSVREQAEMFGDCSVLVSVHGAGLTNMIFMPPGGSVVEIFHYKYGSTSYSTLSKGCELSYIYVSCDSQPGSDAPSMHPSSHNIMSFLSADVWVEADKFREALAQAIDT